MKNIEAVKIIIDENLSMKVSVEKCADGFYSDCLFSGSYIIAQKTQYNQFCIYTSGGDEVYFDKVNAKKLIASLTSLTNKIR